MKTVLLSIYLKALSLLRAGMMCFDPLLKLLFIPGFENTRWKLGRLKAWQVFNNARFEVPAYKEFLEERKFHRIKFNGFQPLVSEIPETDKENYVKKYSIDSRCKKGRITTHGVTIDESSGSSGIPTNWVRGRKEKLYNKRMLEFGIKNLLGNESLFIINAFALGPWATGVNVTMSFVDICMLKSLGPDVKKIENTLNFFGSEQKYVIMGYPPFLKTLVDTANVAWPTFDITVIFGGEAMSEAMREYLIGKGIKRVYGSYGASDLELNIGHENDFTIALRKKIKENKKLAERLTIETGALPMIFQFDPLDFFIEQNGKNELVITLCRPYYLAPKIRYNIHDIGHVIKISELKVILNELNISIEELGNLSTDLPLLLHYGRSDMSVAFFGSKITPQDIQEVVFSIPELAHITSSFTLITFEDKNVNKNLTLAIELMDGMNILAEEFESKLNQIVFDRLQEINQDFREAYKMVPQDNKPQLEFHSYRTGPFTNSDIRIKMKYIQE